MLKLAKYEFRKSRTMLSLVLLAIIGLEIYFLISAARESLGNMAIALACLSFLFYVAAAIIFVLGVFSYSRELSRKSSYLIFMTPKSPYAIVGSKVLFTMVMGIVFMLIVAVVGYADYYIYIRIDPTVVSTFEMIMENLGIFRATFLSILWKIVYTVALILLEFVAYVCIAYLSVTLSATFLQDKKGKGVISTLFFAAIAIFMGFLMDKFLTGSQFMLNRGDFMTALLPVFIQNVIVIVLSIFASGWMLKKRVSL